MRCRAWPMRPPNRQPVFRRDRPFRRPSARDPADRDRTPWWCADRSLLLSLRRHGASAEATGNIVLRAPVGRCREHTRGFIGLDELAEIHNRGEIGNARGLLHVVGHDRDRVVVLYVVDTLFT